MVWFDFIKDQGYFDPSKNPDPVRVNDGFIIPYWDPLFYLEKLSIQIRDGKEVDQSDRIIEVIRNVSSDPKDNYKTWYMFIKILVNLPNEKIPEEILDFIPIWLKGKFDSLLQSSELLNNLLPKFLSGSSTDNDIKKSEIILHHLLQLEKIQLKDNSGACSYRSRVHLHILSDVIEAQVLVNKIASFCSDQVFFNLEKALKRLLLNYPNGIPSRIAYDNKEFEVQAIIDEDALLLSFNSKEKPENKATSTIPDFAELNDHELAKKIAGFINNQGINYVPSKEHDDPIQRILFHVKNDMTSLAGFNAIHKLGDKYHSGDDVLDVFSLLFRDLLNEKATQNPIQASLILKKICNRENYTLPFFKRIALYIIKEHWKDLGSMFWEFVKNRDEHHLFSRHEYEKEVYELLKQNQSEFTNDEKNLLQEIIEIGPLDSLVEKQSYIPYWQLRWYSALRQSEPFRNKYLELSDILKITNEHYESVGEVVFKSGSVSPLSMEQILSMNNGEIADYIRSFHTANRWEEPTIDGLADSLEKAVAENPQKFSSELFEYKDANYIYVYHMLLGFQEAWKKEKLFNWKAVLEFCKSYISDTRFYSEELVVANDGWNATSDWVVGAMANLITEGTQNDQNSFELDLLPIAREILKILLENLHPSKDKERLNMDYPTYSLNSTAGKVLRATLDYSLRVARNQFKKEDSGKWDEELKSLFEQTLERKIIDGYILQGMYFSQFHYLDKDWILEHVKQNYKIEQREWLAFINGYFFHNPPFDKFIYEVMYPHYQRAIENKLESNGFNDNGIIKHLIAFLFWGFENLQSGKLIDEFLDTATPKSIVQLINFVWQQSRYLKTFPEDEKQGLKITVFQLWSSLARKYQNPSTQDEKDILVALSNLIAFVDVLDEKTTELIVKSGSLLKDYQHIHEIVENLVRLKDMGDPKQTAKNIGTILMSISFDYYFGDIEANRITEIVSFLFEQGEKKTANTFCNRLTSLGYDSLKWIYNKYNPV